MNKIVSITNVLLKTKKTYLLHKCLTHVNKVNYKYFLKVFEHTRCIDTNEN